VPASVTDLSLNGQYVSSTGQGTITWEIQNLGSMDANNVLFMQSLPVTITPKSLSATMGGACTRSEPIGSLVRLICTLPVLPAGQSWTISLTMPPSSATVKARVGFAGTDTWQANNYFVLSFNDSAATGGGSAGNSGNSGNNPAPPPPAIGRSNTGSDPLIGLIPRLP
jgi:uncharacterized repeat protein (TIGR01451 family)